jgi:hypothetical protein
MREQTKKNIIIFSHNIFYCPKPTRYFGFFIKPSSGTCMKMRRHTRKQYFYVFVWWQLYKKQSRVGQYKILSGNTFVIDSPSVYLLKSDKNNGNNTKTSYMQEFMRAHLRRNLLNTLTEWEMSSALRLRDPRSCGRVSRSVGNYITPYIRLAFWRRTAKPTTQTSKVFRLFTVLP